jgi:hypothetical protein
MSLLTHATDDEELLASPAGSRSLPEAIAEARPTAPLTTGVRPFQVSSPGSIALPLRLPVRASVDLVPIGPERAYLTRPENGEATSTSAACRNITP